MTYNRDLQEDKERLFDNVDTIRAIRTIDRRDAQKHHCQHRGL